MAVIGFWVFPILTFSGVPPRKYLSRGWAAKSVEVQFQAVRWRRKKFRRLAVK